MTAIDRNLNEKHVCNCEQIIAMATIPCQSWNETYDLDKALKEGTIFPELNKVFYCGGDEDVK